MKTIAPLVDGVVNNALFHSKARINQMPPQINHILCFFYIYKSNISKTVRFRDKVTKER